VRIISIDGGGVLGCGPAELLKLMEDRGVSHADVLAGTSVGGLLVALRATGRTWGDISETFDGWVGKIFAPPPLWWKLDPFRPKYQDDGFKAAVKAELGTARCCDARMPFFIPAVDISCGVVKVYDDTDTDLLADVVLRTAAAPTYFQPREGRWVDGGLLANNPSVVAIAGAVRKLGASLGEIRMLSLATSTRPWKDPGVGRRMSKLEWASPLLRLGLEGGEEVAEFQAQALLGSRHLRIDPPRPCAYEMDDVRAVAPYRALWRETWRLNYGAILDWALRDG